MIIGMLKADRNLETTEKFYRPNPCMNINTSKRIWFNYIFGDCRRAKRAITLTYD